jgi:hypothetical protein
MHRISSASVFNDAFLLPTRLAPYFSYVLHVAICRILNSPASILHTCPSMRPLSIACLLSCHTSLHGSSLCPACAASVCSLPIGRRHSCHANRATCLAFPSPWHGSLCRTRTLLLVHLVSMRGRTIHSTVFSSLVRVVPVCGSSIDGLHPACIQQE